MTRDCVADHGLVPASRLWQRIRKLVNEGYTKRALARLLGYRTLALQFRKDFVTARSDHQVAVLYERLMT